MCLVNPYENLRAELKQNNVYKKDDRVCDEVVEILLQSNRDLRKEYHVKDFETGKPHCMINTDQEIGETWDYAKTVLEL